MNHFNQNSNLMLKVHDKKQEITGLNPLNFNKKHTTMASFDLTLVYSL